MGSTPSSYGDAPGGTSEGPRSTHDLVTRFVSARRSADRAVLEGFHALKHALRFGAAVTDVAWLDDLARSDLPVELAGHRYRPHPVPAEVFDRLVPSRPPLPVVALARKPGVNAEEVLTAPGRIVALERPSHAGNVGAAVRVAAAAGAGGLLTLGGVDPWRPAALRGGAGLQFALPVARDRPLLEGGLATARPIVAFHPGGDDLPRVPVPEDAVLAFGTERAGLSDDLLARADRVVAIPMRAGVSSLNLATSVAVALYLTAPG